MKRLYENALIYGRLFTVDRPHLIERYNKALAAFGLPTTALDSFDIDRTGFSPQVAEELGDFDYLDPNGINRRFIILTPAQASLPVVHTRFSNTGALMHEFYTANARSIHALTIKDVIYGEIEDNVSRIEDIEDLLSIEQVRFKVLSAENVLSSAAQLRTLVDRLKTEPDAWRDDAMLEQMVELARITGDIRGNRLVPDQVVFRHPAFWTGHFGGTYIFVDDRTTTVICDPGAPGFRRSRPWQVSYLSINDPAPVFRFLSRSGRLDLPRASWLERSGLLDHRADMALKALIHEIEPEADLSAIDPVWQQTFMARHAGRINADGVVPFLNAARRELARTGRIDVGEVDDRHRFQIVRARPDHPDAWLTNRLISQFVPRDFLTRYVFNKQLFYAEYQGWDDAWRAFVVDTLKNTYLTDKAGLRDRLFGLP
ncbi:MULTISPECIES: DUF6638 family protein [unclassified Roseitalea]|uniref:DUF6638 family protein n=1 Tax=unclassified Roseitalea TaxID=2639107 RepID=UPI00273E078A|nr:MULTISPECIES: DUF6638 family protein [unclassified Roseitalea]